METQQVPVFSSGNEPVEQFAGTHDPVADTPMDQDAEHDEIPDCECGVQVCNKSRACTRPITRC